MIKLLFAMGGPMVRAGAETMVMRYIRELAKYGDFEISILIHAEETEIGDYDQEIEKLGVEIYRVSRRGKNPFVYSRNLDSFFEKHKFDIVHCNMDAACGVFLSSAQKAKVPVRIAHSHLTTYQATNPIKRVAGMISKSKISDVATHRFACSKQAGYFLFDGKDFAIINNALDLNEYLEDSTAGAFLRNKYQIKDNELVIGHIGRFCEQKNHIYLLDICRKLLEKNFQFKLVLVGTGPLLDDIKDQVMKMNLNKKILFVGVSNEIPKLLQVFDVFVMPSLFEGLPITGIEAQASGLPCIFSDRITPEVCMTDNARMLSLENVDDWVNMLSNDKFSRNTLAANTALEKRGYSIQKEALKLADIYREMIGEN